MSVKNFNVRHLPDSNPMSLIISSYAHLGSSVLYLEDHIEVVCEEKRVYETEKP